MKQYKINKAFKAQGMQWRYKGKTDDWKTVVEEFNKYPTTGDGIRITDTQTGEIIYEQTR